MTIFFLHPEIRSTAIRMKKVFEKRVFIKCHSKLFYSKTEPVSIVCETSDYKFIYKTLIGTGDLNKFYCSVNFS
jgi:hypothetical protein